MRTQSYNAKLFRTRDRTQKKEKRTFTHNNAWCDVSQVAKAPYIVVPSRMAAAPSAQQLRDGENRSAQALR